MPPRLRVRHRRFTKSSPRCFTSGVAVSLPSLAQLKQLANDLVALTKELNAARLEGFIKLALEKQVQGSETAA